MHSLSKIALAGAASALALAHAPAAQAQVDPFIAQTVAFPYTFCPRGWAPANGQLLAINQYQALFSLVGTTYGGDGRTTFGLPDLRGRTPIGVGTGPGLPTQAWGAKSGSTSFTLTTANMPSHSHTGLMRASNQAGDSVNPAGKALAVDHTGNMLYHTAGATTDMGAGLLKIDNAGGNRPVNKTSPRLAMRWCIALVGIFPSRN